MDALLLHLMMFLPHHYVAFTMPVRSAVWCQRELGGRVGHLSWQWICR
jgi:hypothetical protein